MVETYVFLRLILLPQVANKLTTVSLLFIKTCFSGSQTAQYQRLGDVFELVRDGLDILFDNAIASPFGEAYTNLTSPSPSQRAASEQQTVSSVVVILRFVLSTLSLMALCLARRNVCSARLLTALLTPVFHLLAFAVLMTMALCFLFGTHSALTLQLVLL